MIEKGLVTASEWVEKILAGKKTWEIKTKPRHETVRLALAKKGNLLVAVCTLGKSIPLPEAEIEKTFEKHQATRQEIYKIYGERPLYYGWPISDLRPLSPPIKYKHPGGGASVTLRPANVSEWDRLQGCAEDGHG